MLGSSVGLRDTVPINHIKRNCLIIVIPTTCRFPTHLLPSQLSPCNPVPQPGLVPVIKPPAYLVHTTRPTPTLRLRIFGYGKTGRRGNSVKLSYLFPQSITSSSSACILQSTCDIMLQSMNTEHKATDGRIYGRVERVANDLVVFIAERGRRILFRYVGMSLQYPSAAEYRCTQC